MDLFDKLEERPAPFRSFISEGYGYYIFPKLEGPLGPDMKFEGKDVVVWSINDYLGVGSNQHILDYDRKLMESGEYSFSSPMGARMMTGNTTNHEMLEQELAEFVGKPSAMLLNYGYQGIMSTISALVDRNDFLIYDELSHACIVDGKQLAMAEKSVFKHNDIESFRKQLERADRKRKPGSSILVVTEGVFGMTGDLGILPEIIEMKKEIPFRLLVDDAHGFGTLGHDGSGAGTQLGCMDGIDVYFGTFAKAVALIGAFIATEPRVTEFLKGVARSQVFAKSLPTPLVESARERLRQIRQHPEWREKLWSNTLKLRQGLLDIGYNVLPSESPVTPVLTQGSTDLCTDIMRKLREEHGVFVSGVAYPVVPRDTVLIRLIPTAAHNDAHIEKTLEAFDAIKDFVFESSAKITA